MMRRRQGLTEGIFELFRLMATLLAATGSLTSPTAWIATYTQLSNLQSCKQICQLGKLTTKSLSTKSLSTKSLSHSLSLSLSLYFSLVRSRAIVERPVISFEQDQASTCILTES